MMLHRMAKMAAALLPARAIAAFPSCKALTGRAVPATAHP